MPHTSSQPFYFRLSMILLMLGLIVLLIVMAREILIPLCFAALLALLLLPIVHYLESKRLGRVSSILIALSLSLIIIGGVLYFFYIQVSYFLEDIPAIQRQLDHHYHTVQVWVRQQFNLGMREQDRIVNDATDHIKNNGSGFIGETVFSLSRFVTILLLLPVYAFLILYYRTMLRQFILDILGKHSAKAEEVMEESKTIVQGYMVGLMIEMVIVATINTAGLLLLGIKYAILLGVLSAVLNLIPYIGMLIATIFCMLITLTSSNNIGDVLWVAAILTAIQFVDNNIIMPKVVSSKVKVNALFAIIGVFVGGALAGISGMFLSIPGIAILKAIFERIEGLKPWGRLLGDELTETYRIRYVKRLIKLRH